ncbi:glycosyltransferase [Halorubrum laminariae]|uniref:Glycosyltransferase n=1 Tax=Halorubrum laminariae TaxID=1433523 RepID=A0ABD6C1X3_9EURY|nr:glycosyltransferase [Halorubrum laminariae]
MKVTFVSTPRNEDCGIAKYTTSLENSIPGETSRTSVDLGSANILHYIRKTFGLAFTDSDVIHVQHEYGIFGPKSIASWFVFPLLWIISRIRGVPVVMTFHTAWGRETISPPLMELKVFYVTLNNKMLAFVADHSLFLSEETKEIFESSASLESAEVIPHGVQTEVHPMNQEEAKELLGFNPDEPLVAEPGYIRPEKGNDFMVEVAKQIPDRTIVLGGGIQSESERWYLEEIQEEAPDNLQITGVLDDEEFHAFFNAIDVAVLPYEQMSQSGIVNWCVAYDVPMVASDIHRFKNLEEGEGIVKTFSQGDADAATTVIENVLQNDGELKDMLEEYRTNRTMDEVGKKHMQVYQDD